MRVLIVLVVLAALVGAVLGGVALARENKQHAAAVQEEARQQPEVAECKRRLMAFYNAWKQYRADHHNAEPPNLSALIPKYIKDPKLLECPTAVRAMKEGKAVEEGTFDLGRRKYVVTYGFRWMAAGYPLQVKRKGDKTPLVLCEAHRETMYRAVYHKPPTASDAPKTLQRDVAATPVLVVDRGGHVEGLTGAEVP